MSLARLVVTAVRSERRTKSEVAREYGVSRRWVHELVRRYDAEGEAGLAPRSRRPHRSPNHTAAGLEDEIVELRKFLAERNRLRTDGTDNLLAAARETGVRRVVAQSFASPRYARQGGMVKTEDDPVDPDPPATIREGASAMNHVDQAVTYAGGIALRYGGFYGVSNDALATMSTVSSILDDVRDACMRPSVAPLEYATRWEDADALACIGNHTREAVEHEKEVITTHISTTTAAFGTQ